MSDISIIASNIPANPACFVISLGSVANAPHPCPRNKVRYQPLIERPRGAIMHVSGAQQAVGVHISVTRGDTSWKVHTRPQHLTEANS